MYVDVGVITFCTRIQFPPSPLDSFDQKPFYFLGFLCYYLKMDFNFLNQKDQQGNDKPRKKGKSQGPKMPGSIAGAILISRRSIWWFRVLALLCRK